VGRLYGVMIVGTILLLSFGATAKETWVRTFTGPDHGALFDVVLAGDGHVLAVGATNHVHTPTREGDVLLVKLTVEGDVLWERTWGGDAFDQAWSVAPAGDGGFFVFGETASFGAGDRGSRSASLSRSVGTGSCAARSRRRRASHAGRR